MYLKAFIQNLVQNGSVVSEKTGTSSAVSQLNIMARGFFPFGPFMCGLGGDKQIASSYDETKKQQQHFMHK